MLALAQKLHDDYVRSGQEESDRLVGEAKSQANRIVREAEETSQRTLGQLEQERSLLERKIDELRVFERDYRTRLKSYLENLLGDLDNRGNALPPRSGQPQPVGDAPEPLTAPATRPATTRRARSSPASPRSGRPLCTRHAGFHPAWRVVSLTAARIQSRDFEDRGARSWPSTTRSARSTSATDIKELAKIGQAASRCVTARRPWTAREVKDIAEELTQRHRPSDERARRCRRRAVRPAAQLRRRRGRRPGGLRLVGARARAGAHARQQHARPARADQRALARISVGTFATCESCGKAVGKARLQAFPRATLCVECKQREERR